MVDSLQHPRRPPCGLPARLQIALASVALGGCQRVPSIPVLGAYFPSWMLCAIVGLFFALVLKRVLVHAGADRSVGPATVVYPAAALAAGLLTWLIAFRG